jgi:sugar phosphate permease
MASVSMAGEGGSEADGVERVYRKVAWRLLPFLLVAYGVAYLDRINISFAQVEMSRDLGFTNAVYGFGAGIFFIGYLIFELPLNYVLLRVGERRLAAVIMVAWGLVCCVMAFMRSPGAFFALRFVLGAAEAGFAPAFILYVSRWFPSRYQGRVMGLLMSGPFIAAIVGAPASGLIMERMDGLAGLSGWRWMFLLEGAAPVVLGLAAVRLLIDDPSKATWLTEEERCSMAADRAPDDRPKHARGFGQAFRNPTVHLLALSYFCLAFAGYGLTFWLPTVIRSAGVTHMTTVGLLTAAPSAVAVVAMVGCGLLSDKTGHRVRYIVIGSIAAAAGLAVIPHASGNIWLAMIVLCVSKAAANAANAMLWALPNLYLRGPEAAGGVAIIVTLGALGGFLSPIMVGWLRDSTGGFADAFYLTAAITLACCLLVPAAARLAARSAGSPSSAPDGR